MPLIAVVPPALVVSEVSAAVAPIAPAKVVVPVVLTVSACVPSTVEPSVIAAFPELASVASPASVTASL